MKKGFSRQSGTYGIIHSHHLIPKRLDKRSEHTVDLTPNEHLDLHDIVDKLDDINAILGFSIDWLFGWTKFFA